MLRLFRIAVCLLILAHSTLVQAETPFVKRPDVQAFINLMVKKHHFNRGELLTLFTGVKLRPQVIQHIKKPLEKEPWYNYQLLFVNEWRIANGVKFWDKYAKELSRAEKTFGVPAAIIVATIGVETRYGQRTGEFRVIDSLSNIAFSDMPRANFFKSELEEFLVLTKEQHIDPAQMTGSYAGAIGQPQFMPSSYRRYAINFSKSGKIDLMHNEVDVIGSIANYYQKHGWISRQTVAVPAALLGDRYHFLMRDNKVPPPLTIADLHQFGVVPKTKVKPDSLRVRIIELKRHYNKEYWLGLHNFEVIKRYNASDLYAMAVFQLSNLITERRGRSTHA